MSVEWLRETTKIENEIREEKNKQEEHESKQNI